MNFFLFLLLSVATSGAMQVQAVVPEYIPNGDTLITCDYKFVPAHRIIFFERNQKIFVLDDYFNTKIFVITDIYNKEWTINELQLTNEYICF